MRINKYIALASDLSRRQADKLIASGEVEINKNIAQLSDQVELNDQVYLRGQALTLPTEYITIALNKPVGYVCSKNGQGSHTIYDLLPKNYQNLNSIGRLDKNSSGLILLTSDGQLANKLTHPSYEKIKVYEVKLARPLTISDKDKIISGKIVLSDGVSKFKLSTLNQDNMVWLIEMKEGRNRQIRRTFEALNNKVTKLNRTRFGDYTLGKLRPGEYREIG